MIFGEYYGDPRTRPALYLSSQDLGGPQRLTRVPGARRVFSVDGRALVVHSPWLVGPDGCGYRVHNAAGRRGLAGWVSFLASRMVSPLGEGRGSMEDGRRPRASAWQIAGVWIAAGALLLTAARMGLELWQMAGH